MIDIPQQISTEWFVAASVLFLAKHFLADFLFQTDWMAAGKDRQTGWLVPLSAHAGVHGVMTAAIFLAVEPSLAWLGIVDCLVHAVVDRLKSLTNRRAVVTPQNTAFWWLFGADQTLHHLTHLGFVVVLAAAGSAG
jgi:hypothetical protein